MKKPFLVLIVLISCLSVFAIEQSSTTADSLQDDSFVIRGFYKGEVTSTVAMVVKDYNANRLYENSVEISDSDHVGKEGTVFTWTMTGKTKNTVTLTFTFTSLQAKVNNTYYRPAYTIKMYMNKTKSETNADISDYDSMYTSNTKTMTATKTTGQSTIAPPANNNPSYSGKVSSNYYSSWTSWTKSGYCTLNITSYENSVVGAYEYISQVTVEVTAQ